MVYIIAGSKNSGKTTLAYHLKKILEGCNKSVVIFDGSEIREEFPIGYSDGERWNRICMISKLAVIFEKQGVIPIIALVLEKRKWRNDLRRRFSSSRLIYISGGRKLEGDIYDVPNSKSEEIYIKFDRENMTIRQEVDVLIDLIKS